MFSINTKKYNLFWLALIALITLNSSRVFAQGDIEDLLYGEVENIDPVYKPYIGLGVGSFGFFGDVRNVDPNPLNPSLGYKVELTTYLDNKRYYKGNFYVITGSLTGNERSYSDPLGNMNFKSQVFLFGVNASYDFDHFYKKYRKLHPYVSVGFETMTFQSKVDSTTTINGETYTYHYWNDGTIRTQPQNTALATSDVPQIQRDYIYETNLRDYDWGLGPYPQYTFAVPLEIGLDYQVGDRVMFQFGVSYHFCMSDNIDHVSSKNSSGIKGNSWNDDFMYTYFSLHLDLFSEDKTLDWDKLYADIDIDYTIFYVDEDNDGVFDGFDDCIGTPYGAQVDTNGCPFDDDYDGVPDYKDVEPNTPYGVFVDDEGRQISEEELAAQVSFDKAVNRRDVAMYIRKPESYSNYKRASLVEIPEKFKKLDRDNDSYISYDEMMDAINKFFDFDSDLSSDDIYELNDFFFSQ